MTVINPSKAAKLLGISTQSLNRNATGKNSKLVRLPDGNYSAASVLEEVSRRMEICANALKAQPGQCLCCLQPTSGPDKKFIQTHDGTLTGAITTLLAGDFTTHTGMANIHMADLVLQAKGVTLNEFLQSIQS